MEEILEQIIAALQAEGLQAVKKFPQTGLNREQSIVAVSVKSGDVLLPGFGQYLGLDEDGRELYGWKNTVTVLLEVFVPQETETGEVLERVGRAMEHLPTGLRPKKVTRGAVNGDKSSGMFRCPCTLECVVYRIGREGEDGPVWNDFVMRGELN